MAKPLITWMRFVRQLSWVAPVYFPPGFCNPDLSEFQSGIEVFRKQ
jgi:hypothetical protein